MADDRFDDVSSGSPEAERPLLRDMSPDERIAAMDMRTLPNGKTIGRMPRGVDWGPDDLPDFIGARYGGGKVGYVRKTDAFHEWYELQKIDTLEEAHAQDMRRLREGPRTVAVFADDGETVIGEKTIGGGQSTEERSDGTTVTYDFTRGMITTLTPDGRTTVENVRAHPPGEL